MEQFLVKAYNGTGDSKTFAGEKWIPKPSTIEECIECEAGDKKEVVGHYWSSKVIDEQRKLRAKTSDSAKSQLAQAILIAKQMLDAGDSKLADLLKAAKVKLPWEEVANGEATPPAPTPETTPAPENTPAPTGETQVSPTVKRRRAAKK